MNHPNGRADRLAVPLATLAAALLACASQPAFAQSSVTLYGRIDTSIEYANAGPNHVTRMGSGNLVRKAKLTREQRRAPAAA